MDKAFVEKQEKNFWKWIDRARKESENATETIEELVAILSDKSEEELLAFEINLRQYLKSLNHLSILELGIILDSQFEKAGNRYAFKSKMNTDKFLYFRCWVVLQGKEVFDVVQKDIQKIVDYDVEIAQLKASALLFATTNAFTDDDEDTTFQKAAIKYSKTLNYDLDEIVPDEGLDLANLDVKYKDLVQAVVAL